MVRPFASRKGFPMTHLTQSPVTPLRQRMIEDMRLSGLSARTQQVYIDGVRGLAAHYKRSPDLLTEEEVRSYLLDLCDRGAARGTFKTNHYGIRFLYCQTLNRDWALFGKKDSAAQAEAVAGGVVRR